MSQVLPGDPADLFARLYDDLDPGAAREGLADEWDEDDQVQEIASLVEERAVLAGEFEPDEVADRLELADDTDARRYAYLLGLDRAFATVHPSIDAVDRGELTAVAVRFRLTGKLNTDATDGAVLPRYAYPDRIRMMPDAPPHECNADLFTYVTRVGAAYWAMTSSSRLPREFDLPATAHTEGLLVGCAGLLAVEDVEIKGFGEQRRYYTVEVRDTERLRERIAGVLRRLDERQAEIGVMPESALSPALADHWAAVLRDNPPPLGSRLRLILVGTGPFETDGRGLSANRAVLLSRSGTRLVTQDKRHGFTLSAKQIADWGFSMLDAAAHAEALRPGTQIAVLESSIGRLLTLVCEDLGRIAEDGPHLMQLGPSHVLAPIFSKPTLPHHWEHSDAKKLAASLGAHTVVANSHVVEGLMREARKLTRRGDLGTALAQSPGGHWDHDYREDPGEITLLRLTAEDVVRAVQIRREA